MPNRVRRLGVSQALQRDVALTTTKAGEGARFSPSAHHHGEMFKLQTQVRASLHHRQSRQCGIHTTAR
jgi:hypothetical protein